MLKLSLKIQADLMFLTIHLNKHKIYRMKFYKVITLSFLLLQFLHSTAQEIKTIVDKSQYNITDKIEVTYQIEKSVESIEIMDKIDFKFVTEPSQSISQSYRDGKSTYLTSYSFILEALNPGKIDLPQVTMYVDDKPVRSQKRYVEIVGTLLTEEQVADKIKAGNSPYKEYEAGHAFEISLPKFLERTKGINDYAAIEYINNANDIFGYTVYDTKENIKLEGRNYASLEAYHGNTIKGFVKDIPKKIVSQPQSHKSEGINFTETDITFHDKETNKDLYYFIGSVETKTTFYSVVFRTLGKNKNKFKGEFLKILYSLKD